MSIKRVFKTKTFDRWAKKILTDAELCDAAQEIMSDQYEADLGGGVCKKRIAIAGQGKSGGTRTLIANRHQDAIFFITGREKSDPGTDFSDPQVEAAKIVAKGLQAASVGKLDELKAEGTIKEICNDKDCKKQ